MASAVLAQLQAFRDHILKHELLALLDSTFAAQMLHLKGKPAAAALSWHRRSTNKTAPNLQPSLHDSSLRASHPVI